MKLSWNIEYCQWSIVIIFVTSSDSTMAALLAPFLALPRLPFSPFTPSFFCFRLFLDLKKVFLVSCLNTNFPYLFIISYFLGCTYEINGHFFALYFWAELLTVVFKVPWNQAVGGENQVGRKEGKEGEGKGEERKGNGRRREKEGKARGKREEGREMRSEREEHSRFVGKGLCRPLSGGALLRE